jgi:hypothetical protein
MLDLKKVSFDKDNSINLAAFTKTRIYGFECETFENEALKNRVHYEIEIRCIQNHVSNSVFEIKRKQIYINNQAPDLMMEQIADKAAQAIFPIHLKLTESGEIDAIENMEAIKKRWIQKKEELNSYYEGTIIEDIIQKTERILLNHNALKQSICDNWFFHLYFKPLYINYTQKLQRKFIWESPVFGHQNLEYGAIHTIDENCSETDKIYINVKGASLEERSLDQIKKGIHGISSKNADNVIEEVESDMEVQYKLYAEDRSIFSISSTFKTKIGPNLYNINNVAIYHLPESKDYRPEYSRGIRESIDRFSRMMNQEDKDVFVMRSAKNYQTKERTSKSLDFNFFIEEGPVQQKESLMGKIKTIFKKK